MRYLRGLLYGLLLGLFGSLSAQTIVPFSSDRWEIEGEYELGMYKGKESLHLKKGAANLPDASFENGVIEYDVAFSEKRGFFGLHFRMEDAQNFEEYYMRAHQSGNPDAMQYTPVYNGLAGWQLYYGEGHGASHVWRHNEWMHVKLVINDNQMEVYIDDMTNPVLYAFELKRRQQEGYLGLYTNLAEPHFANFSYAQERDPEIKSPAPRLPPMPSGTVLNWEVSDAFAGTDLEGLINLEGLDNSDREWVNLACEYTGTVNLAQRAGVNKEVNTVMARFTITSEREQVKQLEFGYSDMARAYINGRLVYGGQRVFRSRDYRYLGTIGYFDSLFLPLKAGENVITFAVSERFGGWGVRARFIDLEGLKF